MQDYPFRLKKDDMDKITMECRIPFLEDEVVLINPSNLNAALYFEADNYLDDAMNRPFAPSEIVEEFIAHFNRDFIKPTIKI